MASLIGFGTSAVFIRSGLQHLRPAGAVVVSLLVALVPIMAVALCVYWTEVIHISGSNLFWLFLHGLTTVALGRFLNFTSVRINGVNRTVPIIGLAPLFSMMLAMLFLGEHLTIPIILGTISVVAGLILIVSDR